MRKITLLVVHCTATPCNVPLPPELLDRIHRQRGFNGCGYHFYITTDGDIHPMRDIRRTGAHAAGHNACSIGIAYEGGLDPAGKPADTRTPEQRETLRQLLRTLRQTYPNARICGHRDLSPDRNRNGIIEPSEWLKLCPCFNAAEEYADITAQSET